MIGNYLFIFVAATFYIQISLAQRVANPKDTIKIVGRIFDEDKSPFEAVEVKLFCNQYLYAVAQTNNSGFFVLKIHKSNFERDTLILAAETLGYLPFRIQLNTINIKRKQIIHIDLKNKLWLKGDVYKN